MPRRKKPRPNCRPSIRKYQQAQQDDCRHAETAQEKLAPIQTKLQNAIKNVGDRGKYVYIMDIGAGHPLRQHDAQHRRYRRGEG